MFLVTFLEIKDPRFSASARVTVASNLKETGAVNKEEAFRLLGSAVLHRA